MDVTPLVQRPVVMPKTVGMEKTVEVLGRPYVVTVRRKLGTKSVWVASGDYMGEPVTVRDQSAVSAAERWKQAARHGWRRERGEAPLQALAERLESRAAHQPGLTDEERAEAVRRAAGLRKVLARRASRCANSTSKRAAN